MFQTGARAWDGRDSWISPRIALTLYLHFLPVCSSWFRMAPDREGLLKASPVV